MRSALLARAFIVTVAAAEAALLCDELWGEQNAVYA